MKVQLRDYGWYCVKCKKYIPIDNIKVVKVKNSRTIGPVCNHCYTMAVDCMNHNPNKNCKECPDRFKCYTRTDSTIEKPLISVRKSQIVLVKNIPPNGKKDYTGVKLYTGLIVHKLASECAFPERDDCNNSFMRSDYNGLPYYRCQYMKYNLKDKKWECTYYH